MQKMPLFLIGAAAIAAAAGVASARPVSETETSDAALLAQATVSIGQAIATAEADSHGRTVEVALEEENDGPAWIVTTVGTNGEMSVEIDARTGAVTESGPDDEQDENDG